MQYFICGLALKSKQKSERLECVFAQFAAQPGKSGTAQVPLGRLVFHKIQLLASPLPSLKSMKAIHWAL